MAGCCEHGIGHYKDLEKSAEWSSLLQCRSWVTAEIIRSLRWLRLPCRLRVVDSSNGKVI